MKPKISIIIPAYNVENYLKKCLDSVINQTFNHFEIILINDGSNDETLNIAKVYEMKDDRIKIINNNINLGQSISRNKGLEIAKGNYVYFMDSDDILKNICIEKCYSCAIRYDLDVVSFDAEIFYDNKDINFSINYNRNNKIPNKIFAGKDYFDFLVENNLFKASVPLNLIKRSLIIDNNLLFSPNIIHEDELFTPLLYLYSSKIKHLNNKLYKRRIRNNSTMTTLTKDQYIRKIDSKIKIIRNLYDLYLNEFSNTKLNFRISSLINSSISEAILIKEFNKYKRTFSEFMKYGDEIINMKITSKFYLPKLYYLFKKIDNLMSA